MKKPGRVFFFLFILLAFIFPFLLDFNGLYGQDAHEYMRYSKALHAWLVGGGSPGAFHWPVMYPFAGALLDFIFNPVFSLQLVSLLAFAGTLYNCHRILVVMGAEEKISLQYILLFGLLSPFFLRLGVCSMSDMMAMYLITASLLFSIRYSYGMRIIHFSAAFLLALAAVLTRYAAMVILFLPLAAIAVKLAQTSRFGTVIIFLFLFVLWAVPALLLKFNFIANGDMQAYFEGWAMKNIFQREFSTPASGTQHYLVPNGLFSLSVFVHPGFIFAGSILLFFVRRADLAGQKGIFFFFPMLVYILFLACFPLQNIRLLTMAFPVLLLFYFPAFTRALNAMKNIPLPSSIIAAFIAACQVALFYFAFHGFIVQNRLERKVASFIHEKYTSIPVYTMGMDMPLRTYGAASDVRNLGIDYGADEGRKIILIDTYHFEQQWSGRPAGEKWSALKPHCKKIISFERGWNLYEAGE